MNELNSWQLACLFIALLLSLPFLTNTAIFALALAADMASFLLHKHPLQTS